MEVRVLKEEKPRLSILSIKTTSKDMPEDKAENAVEEVPEDKKESASEELPEGKKESASEELPEVKGESASEELPEGKIEIATEELPEGEKGSTSEELFPTKVSEPGSGYTKLDGMYYSSCVRGSQSCAIRDTTTTGEGFGIQVKITNVGTNGSIQDGNFEIIFSKYYNDKYVRGDMLNVSHIKGDPTQQSTANIFLGIEAGSSPKRTLYTGVVLHSRWV